MLLDAMPVCADVRILSTATRNNDGPHINAAGWVVWMGEVTPNGGVFLWNGSSIQKVSPGTAVDFAPRINDSGQIVWPSRQSLAPLGFGDTDAEVFFWNGSSVQQLTNDLGPNDFNPKIGNSGQIVWTHGNVPPQQVFIWDGSAVQQLTHDSTSNNRNPQINARGHVVWEHWDGAGSEICFWNGTSVQVLTTASGEYLAPQINGSDQVVWAGGFSGHHNIYLWDGTSTRQISAGDPDDQYPQINSRGQVAWVRGNGVVSGDSQWNVWFWDGSSSRRITYTSSEMPDLRLNDLGQIVWTHAVAEGRTVSLWNRAPIQRLDTDAHWNSEPDINNAGQVVWVGWDGITNRIFLYTPTLPSPPSGLHAVVATGTHVDLTWTDNSDNETAFAIWRKTGSSSFTRVGVVPPNTTMYADSSLTPNNAYTYEVRATNDVGASPWSNQVTIIPANGPPNAPSALSAKVVSATQVNLGWTDNSSDETAFAVWRQTGSTTFVRVGVVAPNVVGFADTGLTPNVAYTYELRATNDVGASAWSNRVTITPTVAAPAAPNGLAATIRSPTQITLSWNDNSNNETAFAIWRQTGTSAFVRVGVLPPNSTSFVDTGLTGGAAYTYQVRATNDVGASAWSNSVSLALPP
jgi:fibronectin type 3 domain-containing protein